MKRIAFYGGSFDPPHNGHLAIGRKLIEMFALDEFVFIPAFHAPHKKNKKPTSAFYRYAMLALATDAKKKMRVSKIELDAPDAPYTVETQAKLKRRFKSAEIFFVIGADSWNEIDTWREWERVLTATNIIVVTRPDYEISFAHITGKIRKRIVDLRSNLPSAANRLPQKNSESRAADGEQKIYISDAVNLNVSSTDIRRKVRAHEMDWRKLVPAAVANYIEKYEVYT